MLYLQTLQTPAGATITCLLAFSLRLAVSRCWDLTLPAFHGLSLFWLYHCTATIHDPW